MRKNYPGKNSVRVRKRAFEGAWRRKKKITFKRAIV